MTFDGPNVYLNETDLGKHLGERSDQMSAPGEDSAAGNIVYCHLYT